MAWILVAVVLAAVPAPIRADPPDHPDHPDLPHVRDLPDRVAPVPAPLRAEWTAGVGGPAPCATMAFLFEVTFMQIDVAVVEVHVPPPVADRLAALAAEGRRDHRRRDRAAALLHAADPLAYGLTFKRDSDLGKFFKGMLGNMERAVDAGELDRAEYARVEREYRALMSAHSERGVRKGDRLLYRLDGDRLRLIYVGVGGTVLLDEHLGEVWARAVRASFTGARSKMRDQLGELPWRR